MTNNEEINGKVADKLGWLRCTHGEAFGWSRPSKPCFHVGLPDYCGSIAAAWEILESVGGKFMGLRRDWDTGDWDCCLTKDGAFVIGSADTDDRYVHGEDAEAPMAICLAFLKLPA